MKKKSIASLWIAALLLSLTSIVAIFNAGRANEQTIKKKKLFIVGFAIPGEAIQQEIAPAFAKKWAQEHSGEKVEFQYSWGGSSVQARNVISGLEADVVYLSDWTDVHRIQEEGLITHDWNANGKGIVSKSVVVFRVSPGNPLNLKDWPDLLKSGVKVLTPNPQTSGSARWNILALYGSVINQGATVTQAQEALRSLYRNVVTLGESGRATTQDFERGVGDVALTYENEIYLFKKQGKEIEFVIPPRTIYIENPAAVVDSYADDHGVKEIASAFVSFLRSNEAQKILSEWGFRSVNEGVAKEYESRYPLSAQVFDIESIGGWPKLQKDLFDSGRIWEKIVQTERRNS